MILALHIYITWIRINCITSIKLHDFEKNYESQRLNCHSYKISFLLYSRMFTTSSIFYIRPFVLVTFGLAFKHILNLAEIWLQKPNSSTVSINIPFINVWRYSTNIHPFRTKPRIHFFILLHYIIHTTLLPRASANPQAAKFIYTRTLIFIYRYTYQKFLRINHTAILVYFCSLDIFEQYMYIKYLL